jgi:hypothetical protein
VPSSLSYRLSASPLSASIRLTGLAYPKVGLSHGLFSQRPACFLSIPIAQGSPVSHIFNRDSGFCGRMHSVFESCHRPSALCPLISSNLRKSHIAPPHRLFIPDARPEWRPAPMLYLNTRPSTLHKMPRKSPPPCDTTTSLI